MNEADAELSCRKGYHHGNLRAALIEAARRLIAERGPAGFTLSDAAKLAGVSPAAPYRHFRDRDALLAEIARLGFVKLGQRLGAATKGGGPGAFSAMGRAYLAFAREEPALYAAMFNTGLASKVPTESIAHAKQDIHGFELLTRAVCQAVGARNDEEARMAALLVYALTHGVAGLSAPGTLAAPGGVGDPEKLLDIGVAAIVRGLPDLLREGH